MGGVCYLSMGMVVLLMGLVFASVYIYRYFFLAQVRPGERWGACGGGRRACSSLRRALAGCEDRGSRKPRTCPQVGGAPRLARKTRILPPPWGRLGLRPAHPQLLVLGSLALA